MSTDKKKAEQPLEPAVAAPEQPAPEAAHAELLAIHEIIKRIAECPPVSESDTYTVKAVKELTHAYLAAQKQHARDEEHYQAAMTMGEKHRRNWVEASQNLKAAELALRTLREQDKNNG